MVKIITDSCSDLKEELLLKYDIDYAKMTTVEDGVEHPALLTWDEKEVHEFYDKLRHGKRITTTQVPFEEFYTLFEKYLSEGFDIVYIGCSSKQSGSVNTGRVVAQKLLEKYEDRRIICIDSLNASLGEGMLAIEAAKLAKDGADALAIEERILSIRKNVNQYVTVHSLDALKRAGRVKASAAFLGNLMGVKPILISDAEGDQVAYKKVKGRKKSLNELVALLKERIVSPETQTVYVAHSDCAEEEIFSLVETIRTEIPCVCISVGTIGPIIGASIGPDAFGVWGFGQSVTYRSGD